jgi:7,8-dihydroneopterin aldolase/epimerase/oxygenase
VLEGALLAMTDAILLRGLGFYGYHGVHQQETELGQRFLVDIVAHCDLRPAGRSDDIEQTVSYSDLHAIAREVVEGPPCRLIETVAERIAGRILMDCPRIDAVEIEIRKPAAPITTGAIDFAGVRIVRHRDR